jgi:hypothetical protein
VPTSAVEKTIPGAVAGDQCLQDALPVWGDGGWLACMLGVLEIVQRETCRREELATAEAKSRILEIREIAIEGEPRIQNGASGENNGREQDQLSPQSWRFCPCSI